MYVKHNFLKKIFILYCFWIFMKSITFFNIVRKSIFHVFKTKYGTIYLIDFMRSLGGRLLLYAFRTFFSIFSATWKRQSDRTSYSGTLTYKTNALPFLMYIIVNCVFLTSLSCNLFLTFLGYQTMYFFQRNYSCWCSWSFIKKYLQRNL